MFDSKTTLVGAGRQLGGRAAAQLLNVLIPVLTAEYGKDSPISQQKKRTRIIGFAAAAALFLCFFSTRAAFAGEIKPYNPAEFAKLSAEGKPILLDVRADWCPTCAAQAPVIRDLMSQGKYKELTTFTINFDTDTALLLAYHVEVQSTLIVLKGKQEEGRSVGDTSRQGIERLLSSVIH
jgi:thioredoxin 1